MSLPDVPDKFAWTADIKINFITVKLLFDGSPLLEEERSRVLDDEVVIERAAKSIWRRYQEAFDLSQKLGIEVRAI